MGAVRLRDHSDGPISDMIEKNALNIVAVGLALAVVLVPGLRRKFKITHGFEWAVYGFAMLNVGIIIIDISRGAVTTIFGHIIGIIAVVASVVGCAIYAARYHAEGGNRRDNGTT
jgi:uncharacterized membrane protein